MIVIYIQPGLGGVGGEVAAVVREVAARSSGRAPVATVLMSAADREAARRSGAPGAPPVYEYPEAAALALARVARYARWRRNPPGRVPEFPDTHPEHAATLLTAAVVAGSEWLPAADDRRALRLLRAPPGRDACRRRPGRGG